LFSNQLPTVNQSFNNKGDKQGVFFILLARQKSTCDIRPREGRTG
jgi:hypothetical protein